jgi:hypothetical protein
VPRGWARKYEPLNRYLEQRPAGQTSVRLTLAEIATLIGAPLPKSARLLPDYWSRHTMARINWRQCGFAARLDRVDRAVDFTRLPDTATPGR